MESIDFIRHLLSPGDYMASVDLKDAYFSVPIDVRDRHFLRFTWKGTLYEFTCLPFGYSLAPRTFTKILKPVYASLRFRNIRVIFYIDDTLVIGSTSEECSQHVREVCDSLSRLGFTINTVKYHLIPAQTISFLGFVVDSVSMSLSLPIDKVDVIVSSCRRLLNNPSPCIRDIAHVTGLLVSAFRAVKYMRLFYRSVELCKSHLFSKGASYEDKAALILRARTWLVPISSGLLITSGLITDYP